MKNNNKFYRMLLENISDGVYFVDSERRITYWNKGAERLSGYTAGEVQGKCCKDNILSHIDGEGTKLCEERCPLSQTISDGQPREAEIYLHHKNGHRIPILMRTSPIREPGGRIIGAVEIFRDNTAGLAARQKIADLKKVALFDYLTGVGNRKYVEMNLDTRLNEMHRYSLSFGVLFIDVDKFKDVNDTYGHYFGDRVLTMVANTLSLNLRPFDIIGRWGGDEFLAVLINIDGKQLYSIAERLRILVEGSGISIGSSDIGVTVSIGATLARADDSPHSLWKRADSLMYQSKADGRNTVTM